jgi:Putative auto-transporter adhesin, head GIN domain
MVPMENGAKPQIRAVIGITVECAPTWRRNCAPERRSNVLRHRPAIRRQALGIAVVMEHHPSQVISRHGAAPPEERPMTLRSNALIAPLLVATLGLTACDGRDREMSRGPIVTESRDVDGFDSISLRGSARLIVRIGDKPSLSIEGPESAVKRITADVDGDTLHIRSNRKEWVFGQGDSRLTVKVTVPELNELRLEGSNDARLSGFNGGSSTIEIEGAANLEANGRLDELTVHMSGAGRANLRELIANTAKVTVDGVGSVHVHSTESLDATMNGVGAILYSGTPREVSTSMNGVGTISKDRDRKRKDSDAAPEEDEAKPIDPDSLQPEYEEKETAVEKTSGVV